MGAYQSAPSTETISEDYSDSEKFCYGVSRMQGWRISMEDAHNCVPKVTDENALFGVYDGHGGSEVALYCALHFSDTLKDLTSYKEQNYELALKETFMALDKELLQPDAVRELTVLADRTLEDAPPTKEDIEKAEAVRQDEEECEEDEMAMLYEEASMNIEEVLSRYGKFANEASRPLRNRQSLKNEASSSGKSTEEDGPSCASSSSAAPPEEHPVSSSSSDETHQSASINADASAPSSEISENKQQTSSNNSGISTPSNKEELGSSTQDSAQVSSSIEKNSEEKSPTQSDTPYPSSSNDTLSSDSSSIVFSKPKPSNTKKNPEQSNEISSSDSSKDESSSGASSRTNTGNSTGTLKKVKSGKINPKAKAKVKFGAGDDEDFEADLSGSESEDDGFDSDEAVEGSSESDEESDEEESDDEDPDDTDIPTLRAIASNKEEPGKDSGTTAVVALLNNYELYVANAGDSRCVLCRDGAAIDMSDDHKPEDEKELSRIKAAGGYVAGGRVNGGLNLSRAIGDHCYKLNDNFELENQIISAMPDVKQMTLQQGDQFMVLACDGIWNTLSSQEVVDFVLEKLPNGEPDQKTKLSSICEEIMMKCLAPDTTGDGTGCDNMTCIIIRFNEDWLAKSLSINNAVGDQIGSVNVRSENGSGEASNNRKNTNGSDGAGIEEESNGSKRPLDTASNCEQMEAKVLKLSDS